MDRELEEMMRKGATKAKTQAFEPTMRTERRALGPARSGGSETAPRITSSFFPMGLELEKPKEDETRKDPYKRRVPRGAKPMGAIARAQQRGEEQRAANPDALRFEGLKFDKDGLKKKPKRADVNFLKRAAAKPELEGDEASRPAAPPRAAEPAEAPQEAEQPVDFWDNFSPQGKKRKKLDFLQRALDAGDEDAS